jgi:hypothetical protein
MPTVAGWYKFHDFDRKNPHVYDELVKLCREAKRAGKSKIGIGMLWEVMRWHFFLQTTDTDYKLNNDYRAYYARVIMVREEDLEEIFNTRENGWE